MLKREVGDRVKVLFERDAVNSKWKGQEVVIIELCPGSGDPHYAVKNDSGEVWWFGDEEVEDVPLKKSAFEIGDIVLVKEGGYGFIEEDIGKYVEVMGYGPYYEDEGVQVIPYDCTLETNNHGYGATGVVGLESFGDNPMVLFNTKKVPEYVSPQYLEVEEQDYGKHYRYSFRLNLTPEEAERGYAIVNIDPYRISEVYELGGWREHLVKKTLRNTGKGHTEDELIAELQCTLDRARQMREESRE